MIRYGKTKIALISVFAVLFILVGTAAIVFAATDAKPAGGYTKINARNVVAKGGREVTLLTDVESTHYVLKLSMTPTSKTASSKLGVCAAESSCGQFVEFTLNCSEDLFYSNVEFYESVNGTGYGKAGTLVSPEQDETDIIVIRDGTLFYFIVDDALVQIREVDMLASSFGFSVERGGATFVGSYCMDETEVDAAVEKYSDNGGLTFGQQFSNIASYTKTENGFIVDERCKDYGFDYSLVGYGEEYEGSISVEYDLKDIKFNAENDRGGSVYPKIALVVYNERGYYDYICLGVADKSDRVETGLATGFKVWWNHTDLTGDTSEDNTLDLSEGVHMRVDIVNTLTTKIYQIYVNGALAAQRTSLSYGGVQLGFACDYASATVENITVTEI